MNLTPQHLWSAMGLPAKLVFFLLIGMLVWCVYVGIERAIFFMKARAQSRIVADGVAKPLSQNDIEGALKIVNDPVHRFAYLGLILRIGLSEYAARPDRHGVDAARRGLERMALTEAGTLRKGLNILATTGSTAPFVGLVGTIFGIINAFAVMAVAGGGDLTAISGGIAEALVSTAVGIAVAIAGIWVYNYFNAVIDDIQKDMTTSIAELIDFLEKDLLRRSESQAAK